jgi:hypothetical protein
MFVRQRVEQNNCRNEQQGEFRGLEEHGFDWVPVRITSIDVNDSSIESFRKWWTELEI